MKRVKPRTKYGTGKLKIKKTKIKSKLAKSKLRSMINFVKDKGHLIMRKFRRPKRNQKRLGETFK